MNEKERHRNSARKRGIEKERRNKMKYTEMENRWEKDIRVKKR